jgi:hypothetical protein
MVDEHVTGVLCDDADGSPRLRLGGLSARCERVLSVERIRRDGCGIDVKAGPSSIATIT